MCTSFDIYLFSFYELKIKRGERGEELISTLSVCREGPERMGHKGYHSTIAQHFTTSPNSTPEQPNQERNSLAVSLRSGGPSAVWDVCGWRKPGRIDSCSRSVSKNKNPEKRRRQRQEQDPDYSIVQRCLSGFHDDPVPASPLLSPISPPNHTAGPLRNNSTH